MCSGSVADWLDSGNAPEVSALWREELVHGLIPVDPAEAYRRAADLPDPSEAGELREVVLRSWLLDDPEGLEDWLTRHPEARPEISALRAEMDSQ